MQALLALLSQFWLYINPFLVVNSYQQGLLFTLGKPGRILTSKNGVWGTGLHPHWPFFQIPETKNVMLEILETTAQAVSTSDLVPFTVSASLSYEIVDLNKWYLIQDFDSSLQSLVKSNLTKAFRGTLCEDLIENIENVEQEAHDLVAEDAAEWGVEVSSLSIIDLCRSRTINITNL